MIADEDIKKDICHQLGADWQALADYFEIPLHEQSRFGKGREAEGVWTWLKTRGRLPELTMALADIGRHDLSRLWIRYAKPMIFEGSGDAEATLILQIAQRLDEGVQRRYDELMAQRDAETLSDVEYAELLRLTTQAEAHDLARVKALAVLATQRGVTLPALMRQLGLESAAYD